MPKIVDHDRRRRELALVAASLVATRGVGKCTVRNLARAAGFSTGVVSHYFSDSSEMLFAAYQTAYRSAARRFRDDLLADNSLTGVLSALERNLPLGPDAVAEWKVRIAFWGVTDFGDAIREFEETASDSFVSLLAEQLQRLQEAGSLPAHPDVHRVATDLEAMLTGLAIQHLMSPAAHPAESIRQRLRERFYQGVQHSE
ncbi:MAG: TetR family transcriptional regulator C-terminal domain-containing protein [Gammaproteobacteria bacterium]|nr:TetR family transcriptional regulator C-terminal domain-containing protein [Gammaproteobacteria bacterium]